MRVNLVASIVHFRFVHESSIRDRTIQVLDSSIDSLIPYATTPHPQQLTSQRHKAKRKMAKAARLKKYVARQQGVAALAKL
jgi:hypothetical protein